MARLTISGALRTALAAVDVQPADGAAVRLAYAYARAVDGDPELLVKVGPLLLACLTALGLTPAARAAVAKGGTSGPASSPLDELRQRRAARQRDAAAVDTTAR